MKGFKGLKRFCVVGSLGLVFEGLRFLGFGGFLRVRVWGLGVLSQHGWLSLSMPREQFEV